MIDGANVGTPATVYSNDEVGVPTADLFSDTLSSPWDGLLGAGEYTVSAVFTPNSPTLSGSSGSLPGGFNVSAASTTTTVTATSDTSVYGQPVTFTATVMPQVPGAVVPTGSVQFMVDGADVGSTVTSSGTASLTLTSLGFGAARGLGGLHE